MATKKTKHDQTQEALQEIFAGPVQDRDSLSFRPGKKKRKPMWFWILIFFVVAAIVALSGFFFFTQKKPYSGAAISVAVSGPSSVTSGDPETWTVTIKNDGKVDLKKADLNLQYPTGFSFVSAVPAPTNDFHNAWSFTTIKAKGEKTIKLTGTILGDVGSSVNISGTLSYQPANFSSDFTTNTSFDVTIATSLLDLTIKAPAAATSGQKVEYVLTAKNTSTATIFKLRLEVDLPSELSAITKTPNPTDNASHWDQDSLEPGKEFSVTIAGTLTGVPQAVSELKARIGVLDTDGNFRVQKAQSALVLFLQPTLNLTLSLSKNAKATASVGDKVNATLTYSNDSDTVVSDATLTLSFAGVDSDGKSVNILDSSTFVASAPFAKTTDATTIQWTKTQIKGLERITPGTTGSVDVTLPIPRSVRTAGTGKNLSLNLLGDITATDAGGTGSSIEKKTDALAVKLNTELRLAVEGRYFTDEGAPVGSGPLPPQVGATTTYQIAWFVTNTLNGVKNTLLKTTLPDNVTFVQGSSTSGNAITYDATTREVRWRVDSIDAGVGQTLPTLTGAFTVSITPTVADQGKTLPLTNATTLTATDAFTGTAFSLRGDGVTTDLPFDTQAQGKGTVQPAGSTTNSNTNADTNAASTNAVTNTGTL